MQNSVWVLCRGVQAPSVCCECWEKATPPLLFPGMDLLHSQFQVTNIIKEDRSKGSRKCWQCLDKTQNFTSSLVVCAFGFHLLCKWPWGGCPLCLWALEGSTWLRWSHVLNSYISNWKRIPKFYPHSDALYLWLDHWFGRDVYQVLATDNLCLWSGNIVCRTRKWHPVRNLVASVLGPHWVSPIILLGKAHI